MKYIYTIDRYNSIFIGDNDEIISRTDMFGFIESIGFNVYYKGAANTGKCRIARRELARVFHDRNLYLWEQMIGKRGLI